MRVRHALPAFALLLVVARCCPGASAAAGHRQKQRRLKHITPDEEFPLEEEDDDDDLEDMFSMDSDDSDHIVHRNSSKIYTNWSPWSRCMDCIQRRMKKCIHPKCHDSRMYEERHCNKKRCKRKRKQKPGFRILHLNKSSSYLTRQAPTEIWSRWSAWSSCNEDCKTYRVRKCRKPGRCKKQVQKESAYCYHERSQCEVYVLHLLEIKKHQDKKRYQYLENHTVHHPKQRREKKCGVPNRTTKMLKIIGGTEAQRYHWPWHVAVLNQFMEVFCGGTLISPRWVLTASHCVRRSMSVRVNAHDLRARGHGADADVAVRRAFAHPRFDYATVDNDVALLMLARAVVGAGPACLPRRRPRPRTVCVVMGWGKVRAGDAYGVPVLHEAQLPIVKQKTCRRSYKQFLISDNMMCAGWASGKSDTCAGDSGGGLVCPSKKSPQIYTVEGITSFGDGCGRRNKYGIYTTVYNYVSWIKYVINHYT